VQNALSESNVIALPGVGSYWLAARGSDARAVRRLVAISTDGGDPGEPHFMVGHRTQARALASEWSEATNQLIVRCWPGPLTVILPARDDVSDAGTVRVSMPMSRALRRMCEEGGPWRVTPLAQATADSVEAEFDQSQIALIVNGGSGQGPGPTVVDCTRSPALVCREGALPTMFIEAALMMAGRRRWSFRGRSDASGFL
jgi:L-threonylcarbamoyladenylate synthase